LIDSTYFSTSQREHYKMVQFANHPSMDNGEDIDRILNLSSSEQETLNGKLKRKSEEGEGQGKKKRKPRSERGPKVNGTQHLAKRRHSVRKPARDPRDEAYSPRRLADSARTRSPSPVIDFDGLSRPSKYSRPCPRI